LLVTVSGGAVGFSERTITSLTSEPTYTKRHITNTYYSNQQIERKKRGR
jgi:hypothetical protein